MSTKAFVGFSLDDSSSGIEVGEDGSLSRDGVVVPRIVYAAAVKLVSQRAPYVPDEQFPRVDGRLSASKARRIAELRLFKFAASATRHYDEARRQIVLPNEGVTGVHSLLQDAARWQALATHLELEEKAARKREEQAILDQERQYHQGIVNTLHAQALPPLFSEWVQTAGEGATFESYLAENEDYFRQAIAQHRAAQAARARLREAYELAETARQRLRDEYGLEVPPLERVEIPEAPPGVVEMVKELQKYLAEH